MEPGLEPALSRKAKKQLKKQSKLREDDKEAENGKSPTEEEYDPLAEKKGSDSMSNDIRVEK